MNSPFGRVLQAIRENDVPCRGDRLSHSGLPHRWRACIVGAFAALAGALLALWLR